VRPLSESLITILQGALQGGATDVEIFDTRKVRWLRGHDLVASGELPEGAFAALGDELVGLGARRGATANVTVISPVGPLTVEVALAPHEVRIGVRDEEQARAEEAFAELMAHMDSISADRVTCTATEARFARGDANIESVPLVEGALALLVRHGTMLGGLDPSQKRAGHAVLHGGEAPRRLAVELTGDGVVFTVSERAAT